MPNPDKIKGALRNRRKDYGHRFGDITKYLKATGWKERICGSHHIYSRPGYPLNINVQPDNGGKAKGYQIKEIRRYLGWAAAEKAKAEAAKKAEGAKGETKK